MTHKYLILVDGFLLYSSLELKVFGTTSFWLVLQIKSMSMSAKVLCQHNCFVMALGFVSKYFMDTLSMNTFFF